MATVSLTVSDGDPAASCAATLDARRSTAPRPRRRRAPTSPATSTTTPPAPTASISMQKLVKKATDKIETPWGLDWFVQAGHGGNGNRNCTLVEDPSLGDARLSVHRRRRMPNTSWENSGVTPKGDVSGTSPNRNMWRWQSVQEFQYPLIEYLNALKNLPLFLGIETVVPGHEHTSMSVIDGQIPVALDTAPLPSAPPYVPARQRHRAREVGVLLRSRGHRHQPRRPDNNFDCSVPGSANAADPSWNATAQKLIPAGGAGNGTKGHPKTLEGLKWMAAFHPDTSYYVPAHLERAGQFNPDGNNGFNVEHLRDFNNAAPKIAFGMETQPGHGASANRGEYQVLRNNINGVQTDSVGGTTFGGTGRLRRHHRRRVGRDAGRGPQLLVLRQLRLAQPRQLRPRRSPLDPGLLPGRVPAHLHAGAQRQRQAAPADDRRRPAQRQQLLHPGPAHRPPRLRRLHRQGRRHRRRRWRPTARSTRPRSPPTAAPPWARSWSFRRARTSWSASRCATRRAPNFSPYTFPNPSLAADRRQPAASTCRCSTTST